MNPFDLSWALLVLFLAGLPWFIVVVFTGLPRFTIAHIGWMTAIIGSRLDAHRSGLNDSQFPSGALLPLLPTPNMVEKPA